jgi:hypothetical protein
LGARRGEEKGHRHHVIPKRGAPPFASTQARPGGAGGIRSSIGLAAGRSSLRGVGLEQTYLSAGHGHELSRFGIILALNERLVSRARPSAGLAPRNGGLSMRGSRLFDISDTLHLNCIAGVPESLHTGTERPHLQFLPVLSVFLAISWHPTALFGGCAPIEIRFPNR